MEKKEYWVNDIGPLSAQSQAFTDENSPKEPFLEDELRAQVSSDIGESEDEGSETGMSRGDEATDEEESEDESDEKSVDEESTKEEPEQESDEGDEEDEKASDDDVFEFLDEEGNPFKPEAPIKYKLVGEDGKVLKEGTIEDTNIISLKGIETRKFSVVIESYDISDPDGFELINGEEFDEDDYFDHAQEEDES
jgi:hypothetical protein